MQPVQKFTLEVQEFAQRHGISPTTLCNRVLGSTYALTRIARMAERIERSMALMRDAMREIDGEPVARRDLAKLSLSLPIPPAEGESYAEWAMAAGQEIIGQRTVPGAPSLPPAAPYLVTATLNLNEAGDDAALRMMSVLELLRQVQLIPDGKLLVEQRIRRSRSVQLGRVLVEACVSAEAEAA